MTISSYQKIVAQSALSFIVGSQVVHHYFKPLNGIEELVQEKKSKLWQEYLEGRSKRGLERQTVDQVKN